MEMKRLLALAVPAVSVCTRFVVGKSLSACGRRSPLGPSSTSSSSWVTEWSGAGLIQPGALHAKPNNGLGDPSDRRVLPCVSRYPNRL